MKALRVVRRHAALVAARFGTVAAGLASALLGAPLAIPTASGAGAPVFGPQLFHYTLACHAPAACRVECYQAGQRVADHPGLGPGDVVRLTVSAADGDRMIPRWIEIRPGDVARARTIVLGHDTACELEGLTIEPLRDP